MRFLISDSVHPLLIELLEGEGCQVDYHPKASYEKVKEMIGEYEGLIINSKIIVDRDFLSIAPKLKLVGRLGSGMEIVDLLAAEEKGVKCFNSPEGNRNAVAEQALGMLLGLMNNLPKATSDVKAWDWNREPNRGEELCGKTVGIYGYGHTGSTFAKRLKGFDVNVIAYDKYKTGFGDDFVTEVSEADIFLESDILSLHLPLTEETNYLVEESFISKMQKDFYLINTSRGKVVRLSALLSPLKSGKIKGIGLDVLENEKLNQYTAQEEEVLNQLLNSPNAIITPHIAGWTHESKLRIVQVLFGKMKAFITD